MHVENYNIHYKIIDMNRYNLTQVYKKDTR